ncbi:Endolytic murein transglycosylase [Rhodovastum atsumiense]|uniref:Endolytic murein transglycosylase n=1 Tax=Rhodovastum atsumiense TaxID=504468 RepID=A0A5M6IXY8_9PROT|nr:endolytic transglycosylase MltG [Rhodovastum atsumiense]KAA5612248.1 endolytic transglycosylase MltG [Rhodovastum atsumiense]CAH2601570.1 Endolytic murein transglycosylase [Rhodovastum atsumiense]
MDNLPQQSNPAASPDPPSPRRRRRVLTWAVTLLALLAQLAGGVAGWHYGVARYQQPGPLPEQRAVVVPRGSEAQVAEALRDAGVIDDPLAFRIASFVTRRDGPIRAAELAFPAHASLREVLQVLRTARPVQYRLTIAEGLTSAQIAVLLERAPALTGPTPVPEEGTLMAETYLYERGTTREALLARARAAMGQALAQAWAERADGLPLASPHEMLTLASIVERETARPEERPMVAAVFLNRLQQGMRLQSDPTVIYAVSGGQGALERPLSRADLDWPNPYNTYRVTGLPPGPIAAPGLAALRAVAHPAPVDDLYFVADGNGGHAFARTLEQHNRNVARLRALQAEPR